MLPGSGETAFSGFCGLHKPAGSRVPIDACCQPSLWCVVEKKEYCYDEIPTATEFVDANRRNFTVKSRKTGSSPVGRRGKKEGNGTGQKSVVTTNHRAKPVLILGLVSQRVCGTQPRA